MTIPVPEFAGCTWPMDEDCAGEAWSALGQAEQDRALALASATLRRLTHYRVGGCPIKVRPQLRRRMCFVPLAGDMTDYSGTSFHPGLNEHGQWKNNCGYRGSVRNSVVLPAPVGAVYEVKANGLVLDESNYRVEGNLLIWQGQPDDAPWPSDQDLSRPDTEPGTFSVTMLNAAPVDSLGACAVAILATEFAKAASGGKCRLPAGVTAIVRQGVSMEVTPGMFPDGFTGIREVDTFIGLWNPRGAAQSPAAKVWSPDLARPYTTGA